MSREKERIRKKLENNPIVECNKIQNRFCPELFSMFGKVKDPRHQSYVEYSARVMLGTMYYKSIGGISSMQEMTRAFNDERICRNLYCFMGEDAKEYLPHGVTENEFVKYHRSVLEAKIYFGDNLVCSIASETIENSDAYVNQSDEAVKQDCESKAFLRLAAKIKKKFPRLPIIITADGLYVTKKVLQICQEYHWDYIIRYKEGCASSIAKEYRALPEKEIIGTDIEYQNKIMFNDFDVNLIYCREKRIKKDEEKETEFAWITSIEITKSNAKKIVSAGRNRWKIENQGFNRQKHWQGNIKHACSWNERAQKNHYLMEQIADFMKQLYEHFFLEKNEIKKLQKNISSELLQSFGRQLTETEDIYTELHNAVLN